MLMTAFRDRKVLITGCCGTVGKELVRQLLEEHEVGELIGLDNNESELFFLEQRYLQHQNAYFFLCDIRDRDTLSRKFKGVDIIFHTAAFKHVILCERSPFEAVQNNILGVQNVIEAAFENNIEKAIFTSSDKAVNPTNVMGTSKLMGERLMTAANSSIRNNGPIFASTRFGNVLGSRGSVIPIFREQIRKGGPVTLTDPEMTRFIMSIREATRLVIDSAILAKGGEVFVTKMPVIRIQDLAQVMIDELAQQYGHHPHSVDIQLIGSKPGEKLYEELMSEEETRRTIELDLYFSVLPAFRCLYRDIDYAYSNILSKEINKPYNSGNEPVLSRDELRSFLFENKLIEEDPETISHPSQRYWPGNGKGDDTCTF
jgi:FlaA1/EpsC-like NDP-sugar epimerase